MDRNTFIVIILGLTGGIPGAIFTYQFFNPGTPSANITTGAIPASPPEATPAPIVPAPPPKKRAAKKPEAPPPSLIDTFLSDLKNLFSGNVTMKPIPCPEGYSNRWDYPCEPQQAKPIRDPHTVTE